MVGEALAKQAYIMFGSLLTPIVDILSLGTGNIWIVSLLIVLISLIIKFAFLYFQRKRS